MSNHGKSVISPLSLNHDHPGQMTNNTVTDRRSKVCILNESDTRLLLHAGIEHKCSSRRHHHFAKSKVEALVKTGEMIWLGKHRKLATYRNPRSWVKVYSKNQAGEVLSCGMQLVHGGSGF